MADTRIFRVTREDGAQSYTVRKNITDRLAGGASRRHGHIVDIHATNPDATDGWANVTREFIRAESDG